MMLNNKEKLIWSAGLLEGEGYFGNKNKKIGTIKGNIMIGCHMTDEDILLKLKEYLNCGTVSGPYKNGKTEQNYKDRYMFRVSGEKAYNIIKLILPYMGNRRTNKIEELIDLYENYIPKIEYKFKNVLTGEIETFYTLSKWAKDKNIQHSNVSRVANGLRTSCGGWTLVSKKTIN